MDFGAMPPEVNSARMYAGAGAGPLMAAASAWDGLAAELGSAASAYSSVISGLAGGSWLGPGSAAMAAAAAPYLAWMSATSAQAEQAANQARAAAAAYESAFSMTVPPPVIAANRSLLAALVATNFLGQNTAAIAATEAQYAQMWVQDAAAMYGYAGSSAAASKVTPFTAPQQNTNSAGMATQAAAVAQAAGSSAGTDVQTTLSQLMSTVPGALQGFASPASTAPGVGGVLDLVDGANGNPIGTFLNSTFLNGFTSGQWANPTSIMGGIGSMAVLGALASGQGLDLDNAIPPELIRATGPASLLGAQLGAGGSGAPGLAGLGAGGASAGMGRATLVGALSVPQSWAAATPATGSTVTAFPASGWIVAPDAAEMPGMPGVPGMPVVSSGTRGFGFAAPRYGFRPTVMAHSPAAG